MLHAILGVLIVLCIAYLIRSEIEHSKWYKSPEAVAQREKEAYEAAHAYTKGKCCCGRDKTED